MKYKHKSRNKIYSKAVFKQLHRIVIKKIKIKIRVVDTRKPLSSLFYMMTGRIDIMTAINLDANVLKP